MKRLRWIASIVALLLLYNGTLAMLAWWQREDALAQAQHEATVAADVLNAEVETGLDRIDRTLSGVGEVLQAYPPGQVLRDPYSHRLLIRRHALSPSLRALFLVGPDGRLRNSSSSPDIAPLDVSDRDYFRAHTEDQDDSLFIGPAIKGRLEGHWLIPVSRPVRDQFGRLVMVVAGAMFPEAIDNMIRSHRLSPSFNVVVALPGGALLGCQGFPDCHTEANPRIVRDFPAQSRISLPQAGFLPGPPGVGAFVRGERYGVAVAIQADNALLLKPWRETLKLFIALAATGSIGLVWGLIALHHQMRHRRLALLELERANASLEIKVAERTRELRESEERLRGFVMAAHDAVVIIDDGGTIREFNPSATELFGYEASEVIGHSVNRLMPSAYAAEHDHHLRHGKPEGRRAIGRGREMVGRHKDGREFLIELTVGTHSMSGNRVHIGVIRDITERKANEDTLRRLANTDGLTGVLNRRSFSEEGGLLFSLAERHDRDLAVLMIDADHFKSVNDTHGHDIGDLVLKVLAKEVAVTLRNTDLFGRLGGEEFAALLPETDPVGAEDIAWKVVEAVRALSVQLPGGNTLKFTVSVGVGCRQAGVSNLDAALKEADKALYAAKQGGRNRVVRL